MQLTTHKYAAHLVDLVKCGTHWFLSCPNAWSRKFTGTLPQLWQINYVSITNNKCVLSFGPWFQTPAYVVRSLMTLAVLKLLNYQSSKSYGKFAIISQNTELDEDFSKQALMFSIKRFYEIYHASILRRTHSGRYGDPTILSIISKCLHSNTTYHHFITEFQDHGVTIPKQISHSPMSASPLSTLLHKHLFYHARQSKLLQHWRQWASCTKTNYG